MTDQVLQFIDKIVELSYKNEAWRQNEIITRYNTKKKFLLEPLESHVTDHVFLTWVCRSLIRDVG